MIEMGLLVDYNSLELARLKKVNAQDRFDSDSLKYNLGKVSLTDYMESEYGLLQAALDLEKAQRKYDDSVRSYNNYIGRSLDTNIELSDVKMIILSELDYGLIVDEAYKNYSLVRKLTVEDEFQEKLMDFYEDYDFQRNTTAARTFRDAKHTIEKNTHLKELYFDDIEVKVFKQLKSLEISKNQIAQLLNTIESQNIDYNQLKLQFEQGYLSKSTINEYEIVLVQLEQNLDLLIFDYNTKIYELMTWIGDTVEVNE
jgi:outer membrane protein TolC